MAGNGSPKLVVPFLVGMMLLTGVCNTLLTKYQDMQCVADCDTDDPKTFEQPVLQTLQMFVGESGCWLIVFASYVVRRTRKSSERNDIEYRPIENGESDENAPLTADADEDGDGEPEDDLSTSQTLVDPTNVVAKPMVDGEDRVIERKPLTGSRVLLLALPAICDICATTLMNVGLLFIAASIYQMTRGAIVLFVGLFSVIFLKRYLSAWKWASLFIVVLGVGIVGLAGALDKKDASTPDLPGDTVPGDEGQQRVHDVLLVMRAAAISIQKAAPTAAETVLGVLIVAAAQIFGAAQFVLEESIMEKYTLDTIQVVGWEGIFGFCITLIGMGVLHAAIGTGYFDAAAGFHMFFTNKAIGISSILIMISIGAFNFFGLSVTRVISATSRSTIDTCRTLFIWLVSLGLGWETFKWLQVVGFAVLVYGTGLFNDIIRPPTISWMRGKQKP